MRGVVALGQDSGQVQEQGGLASAVRAHERDSLALIDPDRHIEQGRSAILEVE